MRGEHVGLAILGVAAASYTGILIHEAVTPCATTDYVCGVELAALWGAAVTAPLFIAGGVTAGISARERRRIDGVAWEGPHEQLATAAEHAVWSALVDTDAAAVCNNDLALCALWRACVERGDDDACLALDDHPAAVEADSPMSALR